MIYYITRQFKKIRSDFIIRVNSVNCSSITVQITYNNKNNINTEYASSTTQNRKKLYL